MAEREQIIVNGQVNIKVLKNREEGPNMDDIKKLTKYLELEYGTRRQRYISEPILYMFLLNNGLENWLTLLLEMNIKGGTILMDYEKNEVVEHHDEMWRHKMIRGKTKRPSPVDYYNSLEVLVDEDPSIDPMKYLKKLPRRKRRRLN